MDDLRRLVELTAKLAESVDRLITQTGQLAAIVQEDRERLSSLEERFREHGHLGDGLGSCWDGS